MVEVVLQCVAEAWIPVDLALQEVGDSHGDLEDARRALTETAML